MANVNIKHEIKLQKSVIFILAVIALGIFAKAFAPAFSSIMGAIAGLM